LTSRFDEAVSGILRGLCLAVGWILLVLSGLIVLSSVLRKFFGISIQGIDEYGGYILAILGSVGFSYTLIERGHIRIDTLRAWFGAEVQAIFDLIAILSLVFASMMLAIAATSLAAQSGRMQALASTVVGTPLVYPQGLWAAGLFFFAGLCLILAVRSALALFRRDWDFLRARIGSHSIEEEVSQEITAFRDRIGKSGG